MLFTLPRSLLRSLLVMRFSRFIGLRGAIGRIDRYTYYTAVTLPFAMLGLFEGIRHWGAGPTIIIITVSIFFRR